MNADNPGESPAELEALARRLEAHGDFRVLRRLGPIARYAAADSGRAVRRALIVDVETTGLTFATDAIIELGLVLFTYDAATGQVCDVLATESWFDDPGRPIPPDVVALTGITDDDVRGQRIDDERVRELATDVGIIIAHNAAFDRPFVDRRFPFLGALHWGCSLQDVPWRAHGVASNKLEYLLVTHAGMFLDTHHRALDDCRATLHVLATSFGDARIPLALLLANCRAPRVRISAVGSRFETKDVLRKRGYSWSGDTGAPPRTWCRELLASEADAELAWLREHVYGGVVAGVQPTVASVDLRKRYAATAGESGSERR